MGKIGKGFIVAELMVMSMETVEAASQEEALEKYGDPSTEHEEDEVLMLAVFTPEELQELIKGKGLCGVENGVPIPVEYDPGYRMFKP